MPKEMQEPDAVVMFTTNFDLLTDQNPQGRMKLVDSVSHTLHITGDHEPTIEPKRRPDDRAPDGIEPYVSQMVVHWSSVMSLASQVSPNI